MIATILPGSADFHAVGYNEHKVYKGVATLLEMQNFGGLDASEHPTAKQLVQFLQFYSSQNSRIQKPQFHVAISCKGHEMSEQQLLDFAHRYLQEMGYAEPGHPWLIYAHHDTDNTHLHIVTSRVAPDGRKIMVLVRNSVKLLAQPCYKLILFLSTPLSFSLLSRRTTKHANTNQRKIRLLPFSLMPDRTYIHYDRL